MKHLILLLILIQSSLMFAAEMKTVVLITSVTHKKIDIEKKLERIFRKKLKSYPFNLKVIHRADQEVLSNELSKNDNDAIFWVSHGAFMSTRNMRSTVGVAPVSMILDYRKDNVAPVFQKIHPNIEFLGIIGCNTKQILETYKTENIWHTEKNTAPIEYISKAKSIAQHALRRALRRFKKAYKYKQLTMANSQFEMKGYPIMISRVIPEETPVEEVRALRVMNQGHFLGIMEKSEPGRKVSKTFFLPVGADLKKRDLKIELNSGESIYKDKSQIHFGEIEIQDEKSNKWKVFAKKSGEAFGINKRIFLFKGEVD